MSISAQPIFNNAEQFNTTMVNATEFLHRVIANVKRSRPVFWRDMIPSALYELGQGLVRTKFVHHSMIGEQGGLSHLRQIQKSRAPGTNGVNDPGYDSCEQIAHVLDSGVERKTWTGYETAKRTKDICINDVKWDWEFEQQLALLFGDLAEVANQEQENVGREGTLYFSSKYVLSSTANDIPFTYDPFGTEEVRVPKSADVSTLTEKHLQWFYQYLEKQARDQGLAYDGDMPVFGLARHPVDFDDMIRRNAATRDDLRWSGMSDVLIENYGKVKQWKGYAQINDMEQARFKIAREDVNYWYLQRVFPYKSAPTTVGEAINADPDYINAQFAIAILPLKSMWQKRIPPAGPANPALGMQFGDQPAMNGDVKWLNPSTDASPNLLKEKGHYFMRWQWFFEPLTHERDVCSLLYKRCTGTPVIECDACTGTAGAKALVAGSAVAIDPDGDNSYNAVEVTLAAALPCEAPAVVTVTFADATTQTATLADDYRCGDLKYTIVFPSSAAWVAQGGGIASITCA